MAGFPLEFGKNKVTTGKFGRIKTIRCIEDGDLSLVKSDTTNPATTESFIAGEDVDLPGIFDVTVSSGSFSLSCRTTA